MDLAGTRIPKPEFNQFLFPRYRHYVYSPLERPAEQIRLLRIADGRQDDNIVATIEVVDLQHAPEFCAISYMWGSPAHPRGIFIDGKFCQVRQNCHYALWQARLSQGACQIWIDAICIDQSNKQEKSFQVAMMGQIYGKATTVLACIGESDRDAQFLYNVDREIEAAQKERLDRFSSSDVDVWQPLCSIKEWLHDQDEKYLLELLEATEEFLNRPFWSRLWIIQELCAGHRNQLSVLCGDLRFSWNAIIEFTQILMFTSGRGGNDPFPGLKTSGGFIDVFGQMVATAAIDAPFLLSSNILASIWVYDYKCEDPKDQVYGLLGLVDQSKDITLPKIVPNYAKTVAEIALDIAPHVTDLVNLYNMTYAMRLGWADILAHLQTQHDHQTYSLKSKFREEESINMYIVSCDAKGRLISDIVRYPEHTSVASDRVWHQDHSLIFTDGQISAVAFCEVKSGDIILHGFFAVWVLRYQESSGLAFVGPAFFTTGFGGRATTDDALRWLKLDSYLEIEMMPEEAMWLAMHYCDRKENYAPDESWKKLIGTPVTLNKRHLNNGEQSYSEIPFSRVAELAVKHNSGSDSGFEGDQQSMEDGATTEQADACGSDRSPADENLGDFHTNQHGSTAGTKRSASVSEQSHEKRVRIQSERKPCSRKHCF